MKLATFSSPSLCRISDYRNSMKLFSSSSSSCSCQFGGCNYRALRVLCFSTESSSSSSPSGRSRSRPRLSAKPTETLYNKIYPIKDSKVSIVPILDKWIEEGKPIKKDVLLTMMKRLREFKRFKHALEISQWITDRRLYFVSPGEYSVRLDLISKVHGLEEAEKYFENIPEESKVFHTYCALLNCYVRKKSVEKAEVFMQKMRDLGLATTSMSYNHMLNLYSQVGQYEKVDTLMQEMKEKGIPWDKFTFNTCLNTYAATSNIDGIMRILKTMEEDPQVIMEWSCYTVAANGYIKAGLTDQALEMLKKSEELIGDKNRRVAYEFLITLYASIGKKEELHRIWNLYKSSEKLNNTAYLCMINSLLKLDDISGAEKILEEWESGKIAYDFRVPYSLIYAYCKQGLLEKAEKLVNKAIDKGKKPYGNTWHHLATGYLESNQIPRVVETIKRAILSRPGWKPNPSVVASCLEYLKGEGDIEGAEELASQFGIQEPREEAQVAVE